MKSPNFEPHEKDPNLVTEKGEFAYNLASTILLYVQRFKPEEIIFAMDAKGGYWRHDVMEEYYKEHCKVYEYMQESPISDDEIRYDRKYFRV